MKLEEVLARTAGMRRKLRYPGGRIVRKPPDVGCYHKRSRRRLHRMNDKVGYIAKAKTCP